MRLKTCVVSSLVVSSVIASLLTISSAVAGSSSYFDKLNANYFNATNITSTNETSSTINATTVNTSTLDATSGITLGNASAGCATFGSNGVLGSTGSACASQLSQIMPASYGPYNIAATPIGTTATQILGETPAFPSTPGVYRIYANISVAFHCTTTTTTNFWLTFSNDTQVNCFKIRVAGAIGTATGANSTNLTCYSMSTFTTAGTVELWAIEGAADGCTTDAGVPVGSGTSNMIIRYVPE